MTALVPLALDMTSCATEGEMNGNFMETINRGYTPINDLLEKFSGTASLVGSGPTIKTTYKQLTGTVFAINSAIGFLLDQGVVPTYAMLWDAADIVENFAVPHPDITYLVASRCHPKVFERLKDCKVVVWHAGGDHNILEMLQRPEVIKKQKREEPLINGGSAGVTRGLYLVKALGFTDIHIFGGDSSYMDDQTHIRGSLVPEKEMMVSIGDDPPHFFKTTPEWCAQVTEYRSIFSLFTQNDWCTFTVYGDSMLKAMHDALVAKKAALGPQQFIEHMFAQNMEQQNLNKAASELPEGAKNVLKPKYNPPTFQSLGDSHAG